MEKYLEAIIEWFSLPGSLRIVRNVFIVTGVFTVIVGGLAYYMSQQEELTPCSPSKYPARCYHVQENACDIFWKHSEASCQAIIKSLKLSPTRLIGPILFRCQELKFDMNFAYTRISNADCDERHAELEAWKMRNPDFLPK
jgi:hypothetical protein